MIEAHVDVKTTDGYLVRMFVIAFTKRRPDQVKTNCYAQTAQIRKIRKKMTDIMTNEAGKVQLRELVKKLIPESIGKEIEKQTQGIFPLKDVLIRKVKIMKKPKFDITKLMEIHGDGDGDEGMAMLRPENEEAMNTLSAEVKAEAEEEGGSEKKNSKSSDESEGAPSPSDARAQCASGGRGSATVNPDSAGETALTSIQTSDSHSGALSCKDNEGKEGEMGEGENGCGWISSQEVCPWEDEESCKKRKSSSIC